MSRATVIIPTYGYAPYLQSALASAREQTVADLEICVILDGSPPEIEQLVQNVADQNSDSRIQIFRFPKAGRTGEVHRAKVLRHTTGRIVCYLGHDDLWFPNHVERLDALLTKADFGHSLHVDVGVGEQRGQLRKAYHTNMGDPECRSLLCNERCNKFGLTFGAHTRAAYESLPEGWTETPEGIWTDLYMWRKFLRQPEIRSATLNEVTAMHFPKPIWGSCIGPDDMAFELESYRKLMSEDSFQKSLSAQSVQTSTDARHDMLLGA